MQRGSKSTVSCFETWWPERKRTTTLRLIHCTKLRFLAPGGRGRRDEDDGCLHSAPRALNRRRRSTASSAVVRFVAEKMQRERKSERVGGAEGWRGALISSRARRGTGARRGCAASTARGARIGAVRHCRHRRSMKNLHNAPWTPFPLTTKSLFLSF